MSNWQFNVIFWVAVGGTIFLVIAPALGMESIPKNPTALTGVGAMLTYVLTQKRHLVKDEDKKSKNGDDDTKSSKPEEEVK